MVQRAVVRFAARIRLPMRMGEQCAHNIRAIQAKSNSRAVRMRARKNAGGRGCDLNARDWWSGKPGDRTGAMMRSANCREQDRERNAAQQYPYKMAAAPHDDELNRDAEILVD